MNKRLFLVRHAAAEEKLQGHKDIDRELSPAGIRDATLLGRHLFQNYKNPELIVSSPSKRTYSTSEMIAEQLQYDTDKIEINEEVYDASVRVLLNLIHNLDDQLTAVLLVGHNPAMSYLADYLTSENTEYMDTATALVLDFELDSWAKINENTGGVVAQIVGADLRN
jgi:phosphohistidine phosphatase